MLPVSLEIKNFYSHRYSKIDFSQFDVALLIGNVEGNYDYSNSSGKSAILQCIAWCLFNKARVSTMDDIIFWGEELCAVSLIFKQNDKLYRIKRDRTRSTGLSNVSFSYLSEDDIWIDISGSTATLTNQKIISVLKFDYETFINSAYFQQNDISEFAQANPARKKEILKSIINLSKWDDYEKISKARLKEIKDEIFIIQSKLDDLEQYQNELLKSSSELDILKLSLIDSTQKYKEINEMFELVSNQYQELKGKIDTDSWDKIQAENERIKLDAQKNKKLLTNEEESFTKLNDKTALLKKQLTDIEENIKHLHIEPNIEQKIQEVNQELILFQGKSSAAKSLLKIAENKELKDDICHLCNQSISSELFNSLVHKHQEEVETSKKEIVYFSNKIAELNSTLKKLEQFQVNNKKLETFLNKSKVLMAEIALNNEALESKDITIKSYKGILRSLKEKFEHNSLMLKSLENNDFKELYEKRESLKEQRISLEKIIANKNQEFGIVSERINNINQVLSTLNKEKEKLDKLNKDKVAKEHVCKYFSSKSGVQVILLNALIEDLEKTSNEILFSICNEPMRIVLETQRIGSDGSIIDTLDLKVKKDGILQSFQSLSGGEQFRVSLALRIALSEISSKHSGSSLEFLLMDEINSPLDKHGTENLFANVIQSLGKKYKIIIITHNDSLKEKFNYILDVTKINGESSTSFMQR